jgi:hypothetical protein
VAHQCHPAQPPLLTFTTCVLLHCYHAPHPACSALLSLYLVTDVAMPVHPPFFILVRSLYMLSNFH